MSGTTRTFTRRSLLAQSKMRSAVLFCVLVCVIFTTVSAKPTIYVKNENDKLEPVLVAVSSTVIPLPVYKVGYGVGVQGVKLPKPAGGDHKLITVSSKKKGNGKTTDPSPIKIIQHKDLVKKQKDTL